MLADIIAPSRQWHGLHNLQAGFHLERISWTHEAVRRPINIEGQNGTLIQQTTFSGRSSFKLSDTQIGLSFQDSWKVLPPLIIQAGVRGDWDRFVKHAPASAPIPMDFSRQAVAWLEHFLPASGSPWIQSSCAHHPAKAHEH